MRTSSVRPRIALSSRRPTLALLVAGAGASGTGSTLFLVNLTTGSLFAIGNVSGSAPLRGIAIAP